MRPLPCWVCAERAVTRPGLQFTIENRLEEVSPACQRVETFLREERAHPRVVYCAQLACEELISNVIRYAFSDDRRHEIEVAVALEDGDLRLTIEDDGNAFDPDSFQPVRATSLDEAPVGGRGLQLVRRMSDHLSVRRENMRNIWQVRIDSPQEAVR